MSTGLKDVAANSDINSILIIDDHPLYGDALRDSVSRMFGLKKIKSATTLVEGMKMISRRFMPDLIILDLKLPDATGTAGYLKLKGRVPDVPVLVISAYADNDAIAGLLNVGAAGFIPKDSSRETFRHALKEIWRGNRYVPPMFTMPTQNRQEKETAEQIALRIASLTPKQARILHYITQGKLNKEIAYEMDLAEATVKAHITAMLRKLKAKSRTHAAMLNQQALIIPSLQ